MAKKIFILAFLLLALSLAYATFYSSELLPPTGSTLKINVVDKASGAFVPSTLKVRIEYAPPNSLMNYQYSINFSKQDEALSLAMPPSQYPAVARITASAEGYKDSGDELAITSEEYLASVSPGSGSDERPPNWDKVPTSVDDKTPTDVVTNQPAVKYLAEHTFTLERKPGFVPKGVSPSSSSAGCFGPALIVLAILGSVLIARHSNE